ncbi:MAG: FkbM family methyltransferase [Chryseolinea sp.]
MIEKILWKVFDRLGYRIARKPARTRSRHSTELEFHETATGKYYLPKFAVNDIVANSIVANEVFDKPIVDLASTFIMKGTTVLDVGSNFGQMAILFSRLTGPSGIVHAFDADDFIFEILKKNIEANEAQNIVPHFGAVHDKLGETLYFPVQDFKRFETYGSYGIDYNSQGNGRPVETLTIDSLNIEGPISLMKVDVQGGDLFALRGAKKTIMKHKMPIIFEYEYLFEQELNFNFQQYVDFVSEINYRFDRVINGHNYLILPK